MFKFNGTISNGFGFEVSFHRSTDISYINFEMHMDIYEHDTYGNHSTDYVIFYENKNQRYEKHFNVDDLAQKSNDELYEIIESLDLLNDYYKHEITREMMLDELSSIDNEDYYKWHYDSVSWRDLEADYTVLGYCQGDVVKIVDLSKDKIHDKEYIHHLFFDCPLIGRVEIYDMKSQKIIEKIDLDEWLDDVYMDWDDDDKAKLIETLKNHYSNEDWINDFVEVLKSELPDDYNDLKTL